MSPPMHTCTSFIEMIASMSRQTVQPQQKAPWTWVTSIIIRDNTYPARFREGSGIASNNNYSTKTLGVHLFCRVIPSQETTTKRSELHKQDSVLLLFTLKVLFGRILFCFYLSKICEEYFYSYLSI